MYNTGNYYADRAINLIDFSCVGIGFGAALLASQRMTAGQAFKAGAMATSYFSLQVGLRIIGSVIGGTEVAPLSTFVYGAGGSAVGFFGAAAVKACGPCFGCSQPNPVKRQPQESEETKPKIN